MRKGEIPKLQAFLRRSFGNDDVRVVPDQKDPENAAAVHLGERRIATITVDDEDGDRSFAFEMKIPVGREVLQVSSATGTGLPELVRSVVASLRST